MSVALWTAAAMIVGIYVLFCAVIAWFTVRPMRVPMYLSPAQLGHKAEPIEAVTTDDVIIRGWHVPGEGKCVVVASHGFLVNRCEFLPYVGELLTTGASCAFFDHRHHGQSENSAVTFGLKESDDFRAVLKWCKTRYPDVPIVLLSGSMGAVAALRTASEVDGLILDCPFFCIDQATRGWWRLFLPGWAVIFLAPVSWLAPLFSGVKKRDIDVAKAWNDAKGKPVLLMLGTDDPIVPTSSIDAHREAAASAEVLLFEKCGHSEGRFREPERFRAAVVKFVMEAVTNAAPRT